jgi:hypothetical protein
MFTKVLSKDAKNALGLLGKSGLLNTAYLAGGTALALQLNHRYSYDFDFFTSEKFDEGILVQRITELFSNFKLERKDWGTILGYLGEIRFSLFFYKYSLLFKTHKFLDINIADIKDIAAMKIAAIADRGTKRDFIDLYYIFNEAKIITLEEALKLYNKKFKALSQNKIHIFKSLVYFEDADKDKSPKMIKLVSWSKIKEFFIDEQKRLTKKLLSFE